MDDKECLETDRLLGAYYADLINDFHSLHQARPAFIASHGHTLKHQPEAGITFQAGNGRIMAERTGITVINDFRSADVAQGGQGAPLVPAGDRYLFGEYDACLNLGGFSNISFEKSNGDRLAFDTGPANMALNMLASRAGLEFDRDGAIAASGRVDQALLSELNAMDHYHKSGPKSLGREWFESIMMPILDAYKGSLSELMATTSEHIALQIAAAIRKSSARNVLVTGGGALNLWLMERLRNYSNAEIIVPDQELVAYKEALVFAFLGLLRSRNEINCFASVTGGKKDVVCGNIHYC
jgi:anhydro-N-acetylmuramic acid kinase